MRETMDDDRAQAYMQTIHQTMNGLEATMSAAGRVEAAVAMAMMAVAGGHWLAWLSEAHPENLAILQEQAGSIARSLAGRGGTT